MLDGCRNNLRLTTQAGPIEIPDRHAPANAVSVGGDEYAIDRIRLGDDIGVRALHGPTPVAIGALDGDHRVRHFIIGFFQCLRDEGDRDQQSGCHAEFRPIHGCLTCSWS